MIGNIAAGLFGVGAPAVTSSYESISTLSVASGTQATVEFTSIPSTYKHLQLRGIQRKTGDATSNPIIFNNDSGANYSLHFLSGNGSSAGAYGEANTNYGWIYTPSSANPSDIFGAFVMDILDYQNTTKYKTVRILNGYDFNGSGQIILHSFAWRNTAAISSIKITPGAGNHAQYSSFALYGIKD
jgi:hypothetical protein